MFLSEDDKSEFIKENIDETIFMFALFMRLWNTHRSDM